jgi:hypothetical protein
MKDCTQIYQNKLQDSHILDMIKSEAEIEMSTKNEDTLLTLALYAKNGKSSYF